MKSIRLINVLILAAVCLCVTFFSNAQQPLPKVIQGRIIRIEKFSSIYVTPRTIDIWLPDGYTDANKYAVLYMHDGQMLYDSEHTWNKQSWKIHEVASALMLLDSVKPFIVVGIWNAGLARHAEYFPQKPFEQLTASQKDTVVAQLKRVGRIEDAFAPNSDEYLKFIVDDLKPYIDKTYSVYTDPDNTCIAGSSMGGLISMYAICEYPEIFGRAACLSTHWVGTFSMENNPCPDIFIQYLKQQLPDPKTHKIYFDCGDQTLDALYPPIQQKVDQVMIRKGYDSISWITQYFPGEEHSEKAWSKRLHIPLRFILGE
jgi:predicted alpha/beta superfamily hydrolase